MKKTQKLPQITAELMDQVQDLQCLTGQVSRLGDKITKITSELRKIDENLECIVPGTAALSDPDRIPALNTTGVSSKIIAFPGLDLPKSRGAGTESYELRIKQFQAMPFLAIPGKPFPSGIPDYRPFLQRDGLILLSWDKRITETGERYTAYWVTSAGIHRFYASKSHTVEDFFLARPHHKSYAAEDGIEFYGQEAPAYIVHVAPELMKTNPRHGELRPAHIKTLKQQGSNVDFDYRYLLTMEKKRSLAVKKSKGKNSYRAGA